jgi:hypothetical protein
VGEDWAFFIADRLYISDSHEWSKRNRHPLIDKYGQNSRNQKCNDAPFNEFQNKHIPDII